MPKTTRTPDRPLWARAAKPLLALTLAASILLPGLCLPSFGASRERITSVKLTVACSQKPEAGQDIGTVTVTPSGSRVKVSEPAVYDETDDPDVWTRGETPLIKVTLAVADADKDMFTSSTKVTVSGFHSEIKSKRVRDNGDSLYVESRLRKVAGDLEEVEDWYWDGRVARWSEVDAADKYEVRLYRGNTQVTTVTTSQHRYDFYPYMERSGDYTFRVRGLDSSGGEQGPWTEKSEEYYMNASDVYKGSGSTGSSTGSPGQNGRGWVQDSHGWRYYASNGRPVQSSWLYVDDNWFHLAANGYMDTGWLYVDNNWFYLNPVSDGTRGAMKTGWLFVDNNWFYLNPVSDGTRGAMKTGWLNLASGWRYLNPVSDGTRGAMKTGYQLIDARWYFLDTSSGLLWMNRATPNGRWADASGSIQ